MYTLLKNNIIDFDRLLLEKYRALKLDEANTIILIKLNNLLKQGKRFLVVEELVETMALSKEEVAKRIVQLVNDGFVALELSEIDAKEQFNLDETYKRLSYLLEGVKQANQENHVNDKIKALVKVLEKEFKKILSPIELEMVSKWHIEYQYTDAAIEEAIIKTLRYKNRSINYVDRLLRLNHQEVKKEPSTTENIQELFNKVYVHSK
ncbi:MAG TPA: DnaD domain protein [Bacilli bacterium]|nr:MAG: DNA replication protein DnaD [Tenericutes bacterium ADurb.BinA124]HNZ50079.1 DnaD domain protein [Bacilli bacterium]HOH17752.1 DnaD domain protein [Bacilli bacterium]HPX83942.1 DnaD domain protein [Bacilli bacterium]HQC74497.1 DnaD domain protein [Bacilli bacterium]